MAFPSNTESDELRELVEASALDAALIMAWRDLDDPEAGGSELHAHRVAERWAAAGLTVTSRTSSVPNAPILSTRSGYTAIRRDGRYSLFPRVVREGLFHRTPKHTGLVEVWNGMPMFSPLWFHGPRVVFIHHVHAEMWEMTLSKNLARFGNFIEQRAAPPLYRRSVIATDSASSRQEIHEMMHLPAERIHVVDIGVEERFCPGGEKTPNPHVVAVGRLVPVKQFDDLIRNLVEVKRQVPTLTASIIGEGSKRGELEALRDDLGASDWITFLGKISDEELIGAYRSAWLVASTSAREGWGMTLTEAAACGTPALASDIAGHRDAVDDGVSGILVQDQQTFVLEMTSVLTDQRRREQLGKGSLARARRLSWDHTALELFKLLADQA